MSDIRKINVNDTDYDIIAPITASAQESLLRDTVGWTGKNLFKNVASSQEINDVTFTVNPDGSVTANGTASANSFFDIPCEIPQGDYIFSASPQGGSSTTYGASVKYTTPSPQWSDNEYGNGVSATKAIQLVRLFILSGTTVSNITFYPMIRLATILDDTYEPYHESVEDIMFTAEANGILGAKNLLKPTISSSTINGVTLTVNSDGSISTSGTTNDYISISIASILGVLDENETYILTGCPSGGSASTYRLYLGYFPGNANLGNDYGSGVKFTPYVDGVTFTLFDVYLFAHPNVNMNGLVFKPMIRLASDPDDTYQPYAMTNRELTELQNFEKVTDTQNGLTFDILKMGHFGQLTIYTGYTTSLISANDAIINIPNKYVPKIQIETLSTSNKQRLIILTNGKIISDSATPANTYLRGTFTYIS